MVKVTKVGEEPPLELHCPRGCGNLRYGRSIHNIGAGKTNNCKKCKGVMLTLDDIQTFEKSSNQLRKNKLRETLSTGKTGSLDCPKCRKIMVEIDLFYKRGRYMAKQDDMAKQHESTWKSVTSPSNLITGIPIIGGFISAVVITADLATDLKHGKLDKSVTIDACPSCIIFWFDKTELALVTMNDVVTK